MMNFKNKRENMEKNDYVFLMFSSIQHFIGKKWLSGF